MWLDDMAEFLRLKTIPGLPANSVYVHALPADVKVGIMLTTGYQGMPIDKEIPRFHKGPMQMIVRAKKSIDAEAIAQAASDHLEIEGADVGSIHVNYVHPGHLPALFPSSKADLYEASVNFDVCFVRLSV